MKRGLSGVGFFFCGAPFALARTWVDVVDKDVYANALLDPYRSIGLEELEALGKADFTDPPSTAPLAAIVAAPTQSEETILPTTASPSSEPTKAPSVAPVIQESAKPSSEVKCREGESLHIVHMHDNWGDGWSGTTLTITKRLSEHGTAPPNQGETTSVFSEAYETVFQEALEDGTDSETQICLEAGLCYFVEVSGGNWEEEVKWDIREAKAYYSLDDNHSGTVSKGLAPMKCHFSIINATMKTHNCIHSCSSPTSAPSSAPSSLPSDLPSLAPHALIIKTPTGIQNAPTDADLSDNPKPTTAPRSPLPAPTSSSKASIEDPDIFDMATNYSDVPSMVPSLPPREKQSAASFLDAFFGKEDPAPQTNSTSHFEKTREEKNSTVHTGDTSNNSTDSNGPEETSNKPTSSPSLSTLADLLSKLDTDVSETEGEPSTTTNRPIATIAPSSGPTIFRSVKLTLEQDIGTSSPVSDTNTELRPSLHPSNVGSQYVLDSSVDFRSKTSAEEEQPLESDYPSSAPSDMRRINKSFRHRIFGAT